MNYHVPVMHRSWGNYPAVEDQVVHRLFWRDAPLPTAARGSLLPFGLGRSYGDSCLNEGGSLLDTSGLNRLIEFDSTSGLVRCEAGVSFADLLQQMVPRGWFLPVTPGTKFVTVAGAIANDVHGKNHHRAGCLGRHVERFELARSDGSRKICSRTENPELFAATVGGLGLTGVITWAELRLRSIPGPWIAREAVKFDRLDRFFDIAAESDERFEYTVAWIDCLARGKQLGRGIFYRGDHADGPTTSDRPGLEPRISVPVYAPRFLLNPASLRAFNALYYRRQRSAIVRDRVGYDPFFYPLDAIGGWNKLYGRRGFLQHQCVVPREGGREAIRELLARISAGGQGAFLTVLKHFGDLDSPGLLSFPFPGLTLALDLPNRGDATRELLDRLDEIVSRVGGRLYPAKDARMSPELFRKGFPEWRRFAELVDPAFSSSFWRRVTRS